LVRESARAGERARKRERERESVSERAKERERERESVRESEKERARKRESEKERERGYLWCYWCWREHLQVYAARLHCKWWACASTGQSGHGKLVWVECPRHSWGGRRLAVRE